MMGPGFFAAALGREIMIWIFTILAIGAAFGALAVWWVMT